MGKNTECTPGFFRPFRCPLLVCVRKGWPTKDPTCRSRGSVRRSDAAGVGRRLHTVRPPDRPGDEFLSAGLCPPGWDALANPLSSVHMACFALTHDDESYDAPRRVICMVPKSPHNACLSDFLSASMPLIGVPAQSAVFPTSFFWTTNRVSRRRSQGVQFCTHKEFRA